MLTEKDYCDKDLSTTLKELGYPTKMTFIGEQATIEIPINSGLIQLYEAQKWLREEKDIHIEIDRIGCPTGYAYQVSIIEMEYNLCKSVINNNKFYEEALSEGIKESVKILKEK
jgi:hypothetical protein